MADLPVNKDGQEVFIADNAGNAMVINVDGSSNHSLGSTGGKTNVLKTGSLTTTAVTADQVVLTYTVTAAKTLFLQYVQFNSSFTVLPGNNNPTEEGNISLETPSGTKVITYRMIHNVYTTEPYVFSEPIPIAAGVVIRVVCTPITTTSILWRANFGGYER